jgi:predicted RNA-binding Zn-ribbon protein involved in translation (DUF1610 family)
MGLQMPSGRTTGFNRYNCPNCDALYDVVKVEAGPETTIRQLTCRSCGGPLTAREGNFVLKEANKRVRRYRRSDSQGT